MHLTDFVRVVVQQRDDVVCEFRLDENFLRDLALHGDIVCLAIEREEPLVAVVHVAPNADAALRDKPLLARLFSPDVMENRVAVHEQHVRDDLLQFRILLRRAARREEVVFACEERGKVAVHVEAEALKCAELVKEGAADDEDVFFFHRPRLPGPENF